MSNLNTVDFVLIVLFALGGIQGAFKGFIEELGQKFGFVFGFISSVLFTKPASQLVLKQVDMPLWMACGVSYILLFILGYLLIKALSSIISSIFDSSAATVVDSILGFILGVVEMTVVCTILMQLLRHQTFFDLSEMFGASVLNNKIITPVFKFLTTITEEVF